MIEGATTRLREHRESDLAALGALRNDLSLQRQLLAHGRPNSIDRVREWAQRVSGAPDAVLFVVADLADAPIGFVQISGMDLIDGHGWLGIALADEGRGQGHGQEAVELVAGYARSVFHLRKVLLEVAVDNEQAIALYRRLGFRDVGVLQDHVRTDDGYGDVAIMELHLAP